jgi:thiamine transport system ATP-binding protein
MLEVRNVTVRFGPVTALDDVDLTAAEGATTAVMGPSGCGKSTLLRVVAGLQAAETGSVTWRGRRMDEVPPHQREFGLMFQDYALFPHRSVADNVAFGLRMQSWSASDIADRVRHMLDMTGLAGFADRAIAELSGGEQQRVALARTLAPSPALVMLDEPIGSLDRSLRDQLMTDMRHLFGELGVTVLYVTHDQDEAFAMADHVVVMRRGAVEQAGTPETLWHRPATRFVADFIGLENVFPADAALAARLLESTTAAVAVAVPPEAVRVDRDETGDAVVVDSAFQSGRYRTELLLDGQPLVAWSSERLVPGTPVVATIDPAAVIRLDG